MQRGLDSLEFLLLGVFLVLCLVAMLWIVAAPRRVLEYPWAMSAVFAAFVAPQLLALANGLDRIPDGSYAPLVGVTILCLLACWAGYAKALSGPVGRRITFQLNEDRLLHGGLVLLAIAMVSTMLMGAAADQAENLSEFGTYTGAASMWHFFSQLQYPGLAIVMMSALRRPNPVTVGATIFGLWSPLVAAVFFGRREPSVLVAMIIMLSLFFQRGVSPPRWLLLGGIVAAGLLNPVISQYRRYAPEEGLMALTLFDPVETVVEAYRDGEAPELALAAHYVAATNETGEYGYGRGYWNNMVFRLVPAQLIGSDVKEALMLAHPGMTPMMLTPGTGAAIGTAPTGIGDSFGEFGWFGCLFFAGVGTLFRTLWEAATRYRNLSAQLLYMQTLTLGMSALTHESVNFLPGLTCNLIFLGMVFLYARQPPREC
jgi:hypothetical protein